MPGLYLPLMLRMYIFMLTQTESHEECMMWLRLFEHRLYKEMILKITEQMINGKHFGISEIHSQLYVKETPRCACTSLNKSI